MSIERLEKNVIRWANQRDLYRQSTPMTRFEKMVEEFEELTDELFPPDGGPENLDAIAMEAGDLIVTLINTLHPLGLSMAGCLGVAYKKIKDRTGQMVDGKYVRNK